MDLNTGVLLTLFIILGVIILFTQGPAGVLEGFKGSFNAFKNVWILLLLAFGLTGFLQVVVPHELVSSYLGAESGWKGLFVGAGIGAILPGAPYTILPVAASLLKSGSSIGPVMSMMLSSSIAIAITRIPYEVAFLGWKFTALRIMACLIFPVLGGLITSYLNLWLNFYPNSIF